MSPTRYRYVAIDDLNVFYRDTGPSDAPAVLLLHGFPSSSRMWQPLIDRLGDRYRMVAPDYPGFGHSDAPPPDSFSYTFDHIADYVERLTDEIGLTHYSLVMQDYGGPVGMRLAVRRPERISALIVHNAVCHEDGLGPLWETRRAFWSDRARHEQALRENFFSPTATRVRHVGHSPDPDRYDPDLWTDELAGRRPQGPERAEGVDAVSQSGRAYWLHDAAFAPPEEEHPWRTGVPRRWFHRHCGGGPRWVHGDPLR